MVKRLPTMRETWVRSLGREDLLEKEMATHSSTLAWKIPWTEERGGLQSMGLQRVRHASVTSLFIVPRSSIPVYECTAPSFFILLSKEDWAISTAEQL